jgi:hypothetical protein
MKSDANIKSPNKFWLFFYSDRGHEADECHVLKKEIERLIIWYYLQQFMKKKPEHERKEVNTLDDLPKIK